MLSEHEIELLADLVESPGWDVLWLKVIPDGLSRTANTIFEAIRQEDSHEAALQVGRYDGAVLVAMDAYRQAKLKVPEHIHKLKRVETDSP